MSQNFIITQLDENGQFINTFIVTAVDEKDALGPAIRHIARKNQANSLLSEEIKEIEDAIECESIFLVVTPV